MYEHFTDRARKVMQLANQEAQRFNHEYVATEHVLIALCKEGFGVAACVLDKLHVDLHSVRVIVKQLVKPGPEMVTMGKLPLTPHVKRAIDNAIVEARNLEHKYICTEHLLLGLVEVPEGIACQVLLKMGLTPIIIREAVLELLRLEPEPVTVEELDETIINAIQLRDTQLATLKEWCERMTAAVTKCCADQMKELEAMKARLVMVGSATITGVDVAVGRDTTVMVGHGQRALYREDQTTGVAQQRMIDGVDTVSVLIDADVGNRDATAEGLNEIAYHEWNELTLTELVAGEPTLETLSEDAVKGRSSSQESSWRDKPPMI